MEEAELLSALRAGDESAYEALVRAHGARMLAVARRYMHNEEDARDAVQEAFISAFRSIGRFEGQSKLSTWLHQIVVNACLMRLRSKRSRPEEPIEDLLPRWLEDGHYVKPPDAWPEGCDEVFEKEELRSFVRSCIAELPEPYRTILMMRDIDEMDTRETARLLGLSEGGTKVRLHRARQALRTLLDARMKVGAR